MESFFHLFSFEHAEYGANDFFIVYENVVLEKDLYDCCGVIAQKGEKFEQVIFHLKDKRFTFVDAYLHQNGNSLEGTKEFSISQERLAPYLNYDYKGMPITLKCFVYINRREANV